MTTNFSIIGLDRITADLQLSLEPSLAARAQALLMRPATDVVDAAEAVLVATELQMLADSATERAEGSVAAVVDMRRAAAVLRLRAGDDVEGVRLLLEAHAALVASWSEGAPPESEDVSASLWCLATAAVAHREAGRDVQAAAVARTLREEASKSHTDGLLDSAELISLETVLAFGAKDPSQSRGSIRGLETSGIRLLGPTHPVVFDIRDMHGELMVSMGESRQATRHYAALMEDLARDLGSTHELTVRARSSHAFALLREGTADSQRRGLTKYRELADEVESMVAEDSDALPAVVVAAVRKNLLEILVEFGLYDEADRVFDVAIRAARESASHPSPALSPSLRSAGGQTMGRDQEIAMLLERGSASLLGRERYADALPLLTELHAIVERSGSVPKASASYVLFRLIRLLQVLERDAEAGQVLHDALEARSERDGWGSQRHVAALAISVYLAQKRSGPESATEAANLALAILDATADPESERHRPLLEAVRDGRQVDASQMDLND